LPETIVVAFEMVRVFSDIVKVGEFYYWCWMGTVY